MKCCLCEKEIEVEHGWNQGHNAAPLVDEGRCCTTCNWTKVIPARLKGIQEHQNG